MCVCVCIAEENAHVLMLVAAGQPSLFNEVHAVACRNTVELSVVL